jgi:hypothetical protein
VTLAGVLIWLFFWESAAIEADIEAFAGYAWAGRKPDGGNPFDWIANKLRTYFVWLYRAVARHIIPGAFGITVLVGLILLIAVTLPVSLIPLAMLFRFLRGKPTAARDSAATAGGVTA